VAETARSGGRPGLVAAGLLLAVTAVYVVAGPGRIDTIDGQHRYEVTQNLVAEGRPVERDPYLRALPGLHGLRYSVYLAGPSLAAYPLVWMGARLGDPDGELQRFLFTLTSAIFGGLTAAVLYLFYLELGVSARRALGWTCASAFATYLWPMASSTFEQGQHPLFALLAVYLGWRSARRASPRLAALAGLAAGVLFNYQEPFGLIMPTLALSTLAPASEVGGRPSGWPRYVIFGAASAIGLLLWMHYNVIRFGTPFYLWGKFPPGHPNVGPSGLPLTSPVPGLLTLLASPGKSVFLYSPPIVLGLLGLAGLRRVAPMLPVTIAATSAVYLAFVASLRYFSGDWAWGPRYLAVLLPLWALAFPFVQDALRRPVKVAVVTLGLVVQLLGLSLDHQRFFFDRELTVYFYVVDPWFYFKHSALLARPGEIAVLLRDGVPGTARQFAPGPYPDSVTYTIYPGVVREPLQRWMRRYVVFHVPRAWPLWMGRVPPERRPVAPGPFAAATLATGALGTGLVGLGLRGAGRGPRPPER
jgi:hypothetical protein